MNELEQRKQELIKGFKHSSTTLDDFKKYALMRCQGGIQFFSNSDLIMVCDKETEIIDYLEQLKKFSETKDADVIMKHKSRPELNDFYDSSESGKKLEDFMNITLDTEGQFFIMPFYSFD